MFSDGTKTTYEPYWGEMSDWILVQRQPHQYDQVRKIRVCQSSSGWVLVIQYLDSQGNQLLTAGEEWSGWTMEWKDFELQQGERVIGIQAKAPNASAFTRDIQFVIGRLE